MVSEKDVKDVASNARLNLDDVEVENFRDDFEEVLEMFSRLEEVDTKDTQPAFHPVEIEPEVREDEVEESIDREDVFKNTGNVEDDKFKGPGV